MMICPHHRDESWFVDNCKEHFMSLWDSKKMCATSKRFPDPEMSVIVEVRSLEGEYISHVTYHRDVYQNQGEAFDRDNRHVILWRGWEFIL